MARGSRSGRWPRPSGSAAAIEEDLPQEIALQRLATLCGGRTDAADRLAPLVGLSDAVYPLEEIFWAARTALEAMAGATSLVIVFDDIHWAESTLLDLIEHVAEEANAPVLIACSAGSELLDERPAWGERGAPSALRSSRCPRTRRWRSSATSSAR